MSELVQKQGSPRGTVCFATLELYPTTSGGTGVLVAQTAHELLEQGYEVIFLFGAGRQDEDRFRNADRFRFPNPDKIRSYHVHDLLPREVSLPDNLADDVYMISIRFALALTELTKRHHIDLIEFYDYCGPGFHSLVCPELMTQPMAVRLHSTIELIARRVRQTLPPERMLHFSQEREQLRLADGLLYSGTKFYDDEIRDIYPYLGTERAYPSPPILRGFAPRPPHANARDVLFYGRLSTLKGLDTFLRGLALAFDEPEFDSWVDRIVIAGAEETVASGLTLDEMMAVIPQKHRDRLHFLGHISHDALQELLPSISFAVFANKLESFCYAAHELRVSGTPLILTNLPTFHDFFTHDKSAVFFDGTAADLAHQMCRLAGDPKLRKKLSDAGIKAATSYHQLHYDEHLVKIRPRRTPRPASALAVTALVFSTGAADAEARTLTSLKEAGVEGVLLRQCSEGGWQIGGTHWDTGFERPRSEVDMTRLGDAIVGLRAGDLVDLDWLKAARIAMASDPQLGAVAGWRLTTEGLRTSASHLLPELALGEQFGLGRLIRIRPGLLFAELAGQMKHAGEVGLLLTARGADLALAELPRLAVDSREAVITPRISAQAALVAETDRLDAGILAQLPMLARQHATTPAFWLDSFATTPPELAASMIETNHCRVTARHDLGYGEVMLLRATPKEGSKRTPWSRFRFWLRGRPHEIDETKVVHALAPGEVAIFPASDETVLELRQGPDCGACAVEYGNRHILIDLKRPEPARLALRLGDFAALADARPSRLLTGRSGGRGLEALLQDIPSAATLTVSNRNGWIARHAVPLATPAIDTSELLAHGVKAAVEALSSWQRAGRIGGVAIAIESTDSFTLFERLVEAGARNLTALMPRHVHHFEREGGYSATVMAAGALAGLARRAKEKKWTFDVAGIDVGVSELLIKAGARFHYLGTALPEPVWGSRNGGLTVALVGHSQMAQTRAHLVAAAILLRREFGVRVRILIPEDEVAGSDLLNEFGVHGIERYADLAAEFGPAAGPAVALAAYPDIGLDDSVIEATSLGYLPVLGPANFRWTQDAAAARDAARFRTDYWEDSQTVAEAASALLTDWTKATAAWQRLRNRELKLAEATKAKIWSETRGSNA